MNREETEKTVVGIPNRFILAELPTGYGKTRLALDRMAKTITPGIGVKILIVVPRIVLIQNWTNEFRKWGYEYYLNFTEFVTYVSFPKKADSYDLIIFDEVHHLSERCRDSLENFWARNVIMLSATVSRDMKKELAFLFPDLYICKVSTRAAITDEVLPDPKVFLIPLILDNTVECCEIVRNRTQKTEITIPYSQRFNYYRIKNRKIIIKCTQKQFYDDISSTVAYYKRRMFNEVSKNMFLRKSGERLKWLSNQKTSFVKNLLNYTLQDQRTLTFCNGIPQTEELGKYCVNSKNQESRNNLEKFNAGKINHITACNMLDEGVNLTDCKVGVYATLNSSDRMITQKLGRLLRHPNPVLVIPYFKNTRDEEIANKMLEDYNPELVTTVTNLNQIIL